jgi:peptide-methionine (S)-S-oxide reductase
MSPSHETAILASGCFWGMQDLLRRYPGVVSTRVGYTGGDVPNATYRIKCSGSAQRDQQNA